MAGLRILPDGRGGWLRYLPVLAMGVWLAWPSAGLASNWFYRDNQIAYKLYREGDPRQSLAHWDRSSEGSFGRGVALMQLGRMRDAELAFRLCLQLMPRINAVGVIGGPVVDKGFLASIWYNLGNTLYAQDELKEAAAAWRKALDYKPEHAKARHNLEVVNRLLGKPGEDEDNPAGLGRRNKNGQKGGARQASGGKGSPPKQPPAKSASGEKKGAGKQSAKAGANHRPGSDKDKNRGGQTKSLQAANGHGKHGAGKGNGSSGEDISVLQTEHELRLVEEGVNLFMRHRLNAKHGQLQAPYRGPAW